MLYLQPKCRVEIHGVYQVGYPEPSWKTTLRLSGGWNWDADAIVADGGNALARVYLACRENDIFELPIVMCQWHPEYVAVLD